MAQGELTSEAVLGGELRACDGSERGRWENPATPVAPAGSDLSRLPGAHAPTTANDSSGRSSMVPSVVLADIAKLVRPPVEHSQVTGLQAQAHADPGSACRQRRGHRWLAAPPHGPYWHATVLCADDGGHIDQTSEPARSRRSGDLSALMVMV